MPSYPGVYIEEIPVGVPTISGVATSVTAFIGSALSGPFDEPVAIGRSDFEQIFGGLWIESSLGFAVRDFFLNGGNQGIIVRVHPADAAKTVETDFIGAEKEADTGLLSVTCPRQTVYCAAWRPPISGVATFLWIVGRLVLSAMPCAAPPVGTRVARVGACSPRRSSRASDAVGKGQPRSIATNRRRHAGRRRQ